jgi:predicted HNH restriction endonuclease
MPSVEEFIQALKSVDVKSGQSQMLKAHYNAENKVITSTQLAKAAGYKGYQAANLWYGKLGKSLGLALGTTPDHTYNDGTPIWTFILADGWRIGQEDEWEWRMRPELVSALEKLGYVN